MKSWNYHRRGFNHTADAHANAAMDTRTCPQLDPRQTFEVAGRWTRAISYTTGDVAHWIERNYDEKVSTSADNTV
ncbi:hypothetical protein JG688_00012018 [Phytophthora aleatoria]|uniref:Uncharacterized protein n=1 Tax=Phytophthora aleatoria TaxID=2496075 RepID=A0A8J5IBK1_9STRA|nr:hypothetical protein JG688_00012018 [Phytophthora aleatoria]